MDTLMVRRAQLDDLAAVTAIYAQAVRCGSASFELEPPSLAEITKRWNALIQAGYPFYVATLDSGVAGYAYAGRYRPRPAYNYTFETSVYVDAKAQRRGVGAALLSTLIVACKDIGARELIAIIGDSANLASIELHRRAEFQLAGTLKNVGYKHGRWLDSVLMQRSLVSDTQEPPGELLISLD